VPRSSQQFQSRPQVGAFDQIKSAINSGTRFSPQQGSFPQRQQFAAATTARPTPVPPPKFEPLAAVPPGSEQIGTHKSLEETVRSKITLKEVSDEKNKKAEREKMVKTSSVSRKHNGRKKGEKKGSDKVEIVNELSKILEVLSKSSSIKSKSKEIASIKKSKKKPNTSLIKIQEKLLGLSAVKKEKDSSEESENISGLLNLLSTQSRKKSKEKSTSSISSLQEKIFELSGKVPETDHLESQEEMEEELEDDLSAVDEALSRLLGPKPSEESKLSPEVFSVIVQLDEVLKDEEREKKKKVKQVESLVDSALGLIEGAVTRRENAERRLIDGEAVFDYDDYYGDLVDSLDLSPAQLYKLLQ